MRTKKNKLKLFFLMPASVACILIACLMLSSCITIRINTLRGSGQLDKQDYELADFNILTFSGIGKIIIEQGQEQSLTVEAERNIIDAISVNTVAGRLQIGHRSKAVNIIPTREIVFHLKVRDLNEINLTGAGTIECDGLNTESLLIDSSGLGSIRLNINAESLRSKISGAGKIDLSGRVDSQEVIISGVGSYNASELLSKDCAINISGAGKASVNVTDTLDVKMSGLGNIEYSGSPSLTQSISGVGGSVKRVE